METDPSALKNLEEVETVSVPQTVIEVIQSDEKADAPVVDTQKYDALMAQALAAEKEKKFDNALWLYLQAADVNPANPAPQMAIAFLHCYYEDFVSAGKAYEKALRLGGAKNEKLEEILNNKK